ncbi:MAG: hypothetical protein ACOZIN_08680, partial [Myxococcota bacterium]
MSDRLRYDTRESFRVRLVWNGTPHWLIHGAWALGLTAIVVTAATLGLSTPWLALAGVTLAGLLGWRSSRIAVFEWDGATERFTLEREGVFLLFARTTTIPFRALERVRLGVGPEGAGPLTLRLEMAFTAQLQERELGLIFRVADLNRRQEALDFLFRIAHMLRWPHHRLLRADAEALELELVGPQDEARIPPPELRPNPVPHPDQPPDYEVDRVMP